MGRAEPRRRRSVLEFRGESVNSNLPADIYRMSKISLSCAMAQKVTIKIDCDIAGKKWKPGATPTVTNELAAMLKEGGYLDKPSKRKPAKAKEKETDITEG